MVMTIAIQPQDSVRNHLTRVERASFGDYAESVLAAEDAQLAQMECPKATTVPSDHGFLRARRGLGKLEGKPVSPRRPRASSACRLLSNNIRPILERDDLVPLDSYIRNLPMAYDHAFDRKETRRSRFVFARPSPICCRCTGAPPAPASRVCCSLTGAVSPCSSTPSPTASPTPTC